MKAETKVVPFGHLVIGPVDEDGYRNVDVYSMGSYSTTLVMSDDQIEDYVADAYEGVEELA